MDSCTKTYLKVNWHWIVESDGLTQARPENPRYTPFEAVRQSEWKTDEFNSFSSNTANNDPWNQAFHGATVTTAQCLPMRYLVNKVIFWKPGLHPIDIRNNSDFDDALNIVIFNTGGIDGFAYVNRNVAAIGEQSHQNYLHEFGHCYGLLHPHDGSSTNNDGCPDTWWRCKQRWDVGDGSDYEYGDDIVDGNKCWNDNPTSADGSVDYCGPNPNSLLEQPGIDGCTAQTTTGALHPCCDWNNQDNNLMSHTSWKTLPSNVAITPCQVENFLTNISDEKCDMVIDVDLDNCSPTSAVIAVLPNVDFANDCHLFFEFAASMKESEYRVVVKDVTSGTPGITIHDSGYMNGAANRYEAYVTTTLDPSYDYDVYLAPNSDYEMTLYTRKSCSNDEYTYNFSTGNQSCSGGGGTSEFSTTSTYPNPAQTNETVTVFFDLAQAAQVDLQLYRMGYIGGPQAPVLSIPQPNNIYTAGTYQVQVDANDLANGINYLIFNVNGEQHYTTILKQ